MIMLNSPKCQKVHLLSGVFCDDEFAEIPNVIAIPFTKEYIQCLLAKVETARAMKKQDDQFFSLEYFDYSATWINGYAAFQETQNLDGKPVLDTLVMNSNDYELVATPPKLNDEDRERVDAPTIVVMVDGIKWQAVLKYGSDTIYSETISVETLTQILDLFG